MLWSVRKGERELRCVVRYLPTGLDVRLMKGDEFHRTELHRDADAANAKADEWETALMERAGTEHSCRSRSSCSRHSAECSRICSSSPSC